MCKIEITIPAVQCYYSSRVILLNKRNPQCTLIPYLGNNSVIIFPFISSYELIILRGALPLLVCVVHIIGQAIKGMQNRTMERVLTGWTVYFDHVIQLLQESLRQYGIASQNLTQHFIERLEYAVQTCRDLRYLVEETDIFRSHSDSLSELSDCLRSILTEWKEYQDCQDSSVDSYANAYRVSIRRSGSRGRPRFDITKEQLEYLFSLSFTTCDVAALLGVSRTTLYRLFYKPFYTFNYGTVSTNVHIIAQRRRSIFKSGRLKVFIQ